MMARLLMLFAACAALATGCIGQNRDTTLYHRSGRAKPIVAVLPMIDSSGKQLVNWDVSREMTEEIRKRVFTSSNLYLLREGGSLELAKQLNVASPAEIDRQPIDQLGPAEFVVVTELIDQKAEPYGIKGDKPHLEEIGAVMAMAMRVRVLDLRGEKPKIILQEVLNHEQNVSRTYLNCDYKRASWGTEAFERTPIGMVHNKIARELVARVEGYIGASKG